MTAEQKSRFTFCIALGLGLGMGNVVSRSVGEHHGFLMGMVAGALAAAISSGLVGFVAHKLGEHAPRKSAHRS